MLNCLDMYVDDSVDKQTNKQTVGQIKMWLQETTILRVGFSERRGTGKQNSTTTISNNNNNNNNNQTLSYN